MAKLDPKGVKKVNQSKLISASKEIGIKNPEKVSKENLISAFAKAVEATPEDKQGELKEDVVEMYNGLVKTFGWDQDTGSDVTAQTATAPDSVPKPKKTPEKKEKKESYSRILAFCDAIRSKKSGKFEALIDLSNQKYASKGGKDNIKEATTVGNMGIRFLVGVGTASVEGENFKLL